MDTSLASLSDRFRPFAEALIEKCAAEGILLVVICTLRTEQQQQDCIKRGVSWTTRSKHLTGDAIDVATAELIKQKNWAPGDPLWQQIGSIGESLGMTWGGRWTHKDMGHFEFKEG